MFHEAARKTYDAALCMYHDQALIPIKTLAFDHGVNVTLGLPFVRTSPDHGTAFDIAGTGKADPSSLVAALKLAARLAAADRAQAARSPAAAHRMSAVDDLPPLRDVIRRHGLSAKKSLGQNFLLDLNLTGRIARAAGPLDGATVVEIGPGPGGLTRALLAEGARRVIAVERDERAIAALEEIAAHYPGRLEIVAGDALEFDRDAASRRRAGAHRRQPALQHRHRAAGRLADHRAVAALVRPPGADVPARGGRAHRRPARQQDLRPAVGAGRLAHAGENPVRRPSVDLRAAAQGDLVGGRVHPARRRRCPATARMLERVTEAAFGQRRKMLRQSLQYAQRPIRCRCWPRPASSRPRAPRKSRSRVSSHSPARLKRLKCR